MQQNYNLLILVDIIVTNKGQMIQALRPVFDSKNPMPLTEDETTSWLNKIHPDRMNSRILGNLGGRSLARAKRLVNAALGNLPPESIEIKEDMELGSLHLWADDFLKIL